MHECLNCGHRSLMWEADFSFEDFGMEGEGIVSTWTCSNCGADVEVYVPSEKKDEKE